MSAQKAFSKLKRMGKEAYQFQFVSKFEYITLDCNGTWRPTQLRVVWFRNHRRVESIPVQWIVSEDRGPNGASGKGKFKPAFSVGLLVTLYKGKFADKFEGKEYKYYIQDESEKGTKILASFNLDLGDYVNTDAQGSRNLLDMTFQNASRKVRDVMLGMTLTSQLLKKGKAIDYDMQSTFSAVTSDQCSLQLDSDESGDNEGGGEEGSEDVRGVRRVKENGVHMHMTEMAPGSDTASSSFKPEQNGTQNSKGLRKQMTPTSFPPSYSSTSPLNPQDLAAPSHSPHPVLQYTHPSTPPVLSRSPSPSPTASPTPFRTPSPIPFSPTTSPVGKRKEKKEKKTLKSFFQPSRRVSIKCKTDQQGEPALSLSPPPLSPPPTVTDSTHRPWKEIAEMVQKLQQSVLRLENENKILHASMEIQGWLFKRGVRGVTARVWRRRFFRCEGSKIYYYKTSSASKAQGFIDLDLVLGVREVCPDEQDKNCSTFLVRCEGRTFQLQAVNPPTMNKWIRAIQFLTDWRKSYGQKREADTEGLRDTAPQHQLTAVQ